MRLSEMGVKATPNKINKVMESRFGFSIDYSKLTYSKAADLRHALSENLQKIKHSFGAHTAEKNPKYMELLMVREGLTRWMDEHRPLNESEMAKSEAILAAKDIVDSIQDMLEDVSKMQNEELPALLDTIRDQLGTEKADAFKSSISPIFQQLYDTLSQGRESADTAARSLAGEQVATPMDMGTGGMDTGMGGADLGVDAGASDLDADALAGDEFAATDAAAGGDEALGRERR